MPASKRATICRDALRRRLRLCWRCGCMPRWTASVRRAPSSGCANTTLRIAGLLSEFRRDSGALLDTLLTQSLTALIAEGLISLEEMAIDGTKVRARAGHNSLAGRERLDRIEAAVAERVTTLKSELEQDAGAEERKRRARSLQPRKNARGGSHERSNGLPNASRRSWRGRCRRPRKKRRKARLPYRFPIRMCARCEWRMGQHTRRGTYRWRPPRALW